MRADTLLIKVLHLAFPFLKVHGDPGVFLARSVDRRRKRQQQHEHPLHAPHPSTPPSKPRVFLSTCRIVSKKRASEIMNEKTIRITPKYMLTTAILELQSLRGVVYFTVPL